MPNKTAAIYVCANCDAQSPKWSGRCLECGGWGTLGLKTVEVRGGNKAAAASYEPAPIIDLNKLTAASELATASRLKTNIAEIDRVLGGGIMPGSLILLAGEPGVGKSTLVAQIADATAREKNQEVIYVSGEESAGQIKHRLDRLKINVAGIKFASETNVEKIIAAITARQPRLVIVDSIQTIYSSLAPSEAGGINQIRACSVSLLEAAKRHNIAIIIIGHITKDGLIAGPKTLEHIVDTVVYLDSEPWHNYKILRATKNRFGSVNEVGIFEMGENGFKEIVNPSAIFLETGQANLSGSVVSCIMQGSRPFLVEIQALVTKTVFGYPQRKTSGFDLNRLQVLIAVLTKRANINLTNQDVILNIVGGLKTDEPALDLAVSLAIISSLSNQAVERKIITLGEVGLGGEVRNIARLEQRLAEAEKLKFTQAIIPDVDVKTKNIKLHKIKSVKNIVELITHNS